MRKILIVGTGGREHAIAHSILEGILQGTNTEGRATGLPQLLFCYGQPDCALPVVLARVFSDVLTKACCPRFVSGSPLQVAKQEAVDLVIVGPEAPLVDGLVDELEAEGFSVFGPPRAAARLEGSKSFAKDFMREYGVRTAESQVCDSPAQARAVLERQTQFPVVLKADGLAAGKGVLICENLEAALEGMERLMEQKAFGEAGEVVLIEPYLAGCEASVLAFCDGNIILPMPAAKDHKKIFEGEIGQNTGGMGCIAPHPLLPEGSPLWLDFTANILEPTLRGIQDRGWDFCGVIFFGLMITGNKVDEQKCHLLEYNMRFGDPEAQTLLPLLNTPLLEVIEAALKGALAEQTLRWSPGYSCTVVAAAEGYPHKATSGDSIAKMENTNVNGLYLSGVSYRQAAQNQDEQNQDNKCNGQFFTAGGRVLAQNACAEDLATARRNAYEKLRLHHFRGMQYRRDIGGPILEENTAPQKELDENGKYLC